MRPKWKKLIWIIPLAIVALPLFVFIGGEIVMHLWNWLLPTLFGWRQVTFWQALGILVLCRILFGGHGGHGSGRSHMRRRMDERFDLQGRGAERGKEVDANYIGKAIVGWLPVKEIAPSVTLLFVMKFTTPAMASEP